MDASKAVNTERRAQIGQERRARTRAAILEATFQVIGHESGRLARIEQVTEIAQIARPTFYTYFSSMEELLAALSYELSHEFNSAVLSYSSKLLDGAEVADAGIRYYLQKAASDHKWGWGMVNVSFGGPIFGAETCLSATNTVKAGIASGVFKVDDVNVGRDMVLGTALAAMTTLLRGPCSEDYPRVVTRQILVGLGVSAQKATRIVSKPLPNLSTVLHESQVDAPARSGARHGR